MGFFIILNFTLTDTIKSKNPAQIIIRIKFLGTRQVLNNNNRMSQFTVN